MWPIWLKCRDKAVTWCFELDVVQGVNLTPDDSLKDLGCIKSSDLTTRPLFLMVILEKN